MNTIRSTWYGWAVLCVAGGGSYYFAKQQINADRQSRYNKEREQQDRLHRLEYTKGLDKSSPSPAQIKKKQSTGSPTDEESGTHNRKGLDHTANPSAEASDDPAAVGHAPEPIPRERSKYEGEPYRSRPGDRFS